MFSDHSEYSIPFLGPPRSSTKIDDTKVHGYEKPFALRAFSEQPGLRQRRKFQLRAFLSKLLGWPAIVIGGQLILQAAAWGFFAVVQSRGLIALPSREAIWVKKYGHLVTVIFTLLSTILSACSSILFSWGLQQLITLHLHGDSMSLDKFVSSVKISSRSLILNPQKRTWSAMSIVIIILTGVQTTAWSGLLTPQVFELITPLTGYELDLASPLLQEQQKSGLLRGNLNTFIVGQTESGYAALNSDLGYASSLALMDQSFNISTGILPLTLVDIDGSKWFPEYGMTNLSATLKPAVDLPKGLSSRYSLLQQGFTADVTCEIADVRPDTTPSLALFNDTVRDWNVRTQDELVSFFQLSSGCVVSESDGTQLNTSYAYTAGPDPNYILMVGCPAASGTYTLIFVGSGRYAFTRTTVRNGLFRRLLTRNLLTQACTLSPKVTAVQVDYSDAAPFSGIINTTTFTGGAVADVGGPAGLNAVNTIYNMALFSQAVYSNIMGDQLFSVLQDVDGNGLFLDEDILIAMEEYIRGVTEYSGSVIRACLSANNGTFIDGVPLDMSTTSEGFFYTETVGWLHVSASTIWELIPGTIIAIATICTVLMAVAHHAGDPKGVAFDPSNAMHLVSVAAAGGLQGVFRGTAEADIEAAEGLNIVLDTIPDHGLALRASGAV
ncbi:hypothetical protein B0H19DRAFT_1265044 [Mycena capillaripes]|nr:hypothetical protein B0H19DRAFT_1265044 [Mycena capillaripes]